MVDECGPLRDILKDVLLLTPICITFFFHLNEMLDLYCNGEFFYFGESSFT